MYIRVEGVEIELVMNRGSNRKWGVCVGVLLPFEITTKSLINNTNHCKHKMTVAPPTSLHASGDVRSKIDN